jgi:hypothetical protein
MKAKGADLCILNLGAGTSTATGRLMLTIMALGSAKGLPKRKPRGIPGTGNYSARPHPRIKALKADGVRPVEIARQLLISPAIAYRVLAA